MADAAYVVNVGIDFIVDLIKAAGATEPKNIQWGTGGTGAAGEDTSIQTAAAEARTAGTTSVVATNTVDPIFDSYQVVGSVVCASAGKTITEVALYTNATTGICFMHGTFTGLPLSVGDSIQFTIKNVFNQAA